MSKHIFLLITLVNALYAGSLPATISNSIPSVKFITLANRTQLILEQGDITKKRVDAIVNAANEDLLGGDGVCGAIFKAAGWQKLQRACNQYPFLSDGKRCHVGHACITPSFNLKNNGVKNIIHAVGPDCRRPNWI